MIAQPASKLHLSQIVKTQLGAILGVSPDSIDSKATLEDAYDIDSTEITELATWVEKEFGIAVAKVERNRWTSCDVIVDWLCQHTVAEKVRRAS